MAPSLNWDILANVSSHIDHPSDLSRASRTCHALRWVGVSQLLTRGVELYGKGHLMPFVAFVTAEDRRPRFLKKLTIDLRPTDELLDEDTALIAHILTQCTFVEELTIGQTYLLDEDLRIGAALVRLQFIKHLKLGCAGGVVNLGPFLASMRSQCTEMDINFNASPDLQESEDVDDDDLNPMLLSSAPSLEALRVTDPTFGTMMVQYPRLTTLEIGEWWRFNLEPLLYAFPNLSHLILRDCCRASNTSPRETNRAFYLQNPWVNLNHVECPAEVLDDLGLASPRLPHPILHHWTVTTSSWEESPFALYQFFHLMGHVRPAQLSMASCSGRRLEACKVRKFFDLFHNASAQDMTHLQLEIEEDDCTPVAIDRTLVSATSFSQSHIMKVVLSQDELVRFAQRSNLSYLEVRLSCLKQQQPHGSKICPDQDTEPYLHLKSLDRDVLASRLIHSTHTLKYLFLHIPAVSREDEAYNLVVEGEGDDRRAVRMTEEAALKLRRQEGMTRQ